MSTAAAWSVALIGMRGTPVEVEAAVGAGLPRTVLVGLPDTALYEARDRCKAAVAGAGLAWPDRLLTINLTPASLPKSGSHYDLAIVAAVLASNDVVPMELAKQTVFLGELGLDGCVRNVQGVLPALLAARSAGFTRAVVPARQASEAELVDGMQIWGVNDLAELVETLHGRPVLVPTGGRVSAESLQPDDESDLAEIYGQSVGRWALEVAAAGGHHMFLHGSPGAGKTMLASRLPGILPDLCDDDAVEVSAIHSLAGEDLRGNLVRRPPFSDPHHSASVAAMVGGGSRIARPGAISMAHRGVLFLDEAPEFKGAVLESLRTPLESGEVCIARSAATARYPARFQLVLAANPCPCGQFGVRGGKCQCTPMAVRRYAQRISGPILDRIDIHVSMGTSGNASLRKARESTPESSAIVRQRVEEARSRQVYRLKNAGISELGVRRTWRTNAELPGKLLRKKLPPPRCLDMIEEAIARGRITARGVDKILRIAWTLADLAGKDRVGHEEVSGAMSLRRVAWSEGAV